MAGYHDAINGMKRDYESGRLVIVRDGDEVKFSGETYGCKNVIKDMGPRGGGAKWNRDGKQWVIGVDELFDADMSLLDEITGGKLVRFAGYVDGKRTYEWA